jgi:hypothetical protein
MTLLHDQAFGAKMPTYATVLQLDRKLRAFPVPPVLQVAGFGNSEPRQGGYPETITLTLQRHIVLAIREMSTSQPCFSFPFQRSRQLLTVFSYVAVEFRSALSAQELLRPGN